MNARKLISNKPKGVQLVGTETEKKNTLLPVLSLQLAHKLHHGLTQL
jgi:hypothetical protein